MNSEFYKLGVDLALGEAGLVKEAVDPALAKRLKYFKGLKALHQWSDIPEGLQAPLVKHLNPTEAAIIPKLPEGGGRLVRKGVPLLEQLGYKATALKGLAKRHPLLAGLTAAGTLGLGGLGLHSALKEED